MKKIAEAIGAIIIGIVFSAFAQPPMAFAQTPTPSTSGDCVYSVGYSFNCATEKDHHISCSLTDSNGKSVTACCSTQVVCQQYQSRPPGSIINTSVCGFAGDKWNECNSCMGSGQGSWTAIGCIPTSPSGFIMVLLTFGIGIAGGIAFLLILFGGFQILTSAGNPEQLNAGRELITSAISGLLLIIFSVFILRLISVDILGLPGFK